MLKYYFTIFKLGVSFDSVISYLFYKFYFFTIKLERGCLFAIQEWELEFAALIIKIWYIKYISINSMINRLHGVHNFSHPPIHKPNKNLMEAAINMSGKL